jgi:hypothetical protein
MEQRSILAKVCLLVCLLTLTWGRQMPGLTRHRCPPKGLRIAMSKSRFQPSSQPLGGGLSLSGSCPAPCTHLWLPQALFAELPRAFRNHTHSEKWLCPFTSYTALPFIFPGIRHDSARMRKWGFPVAQLGLLSGRKHVRCQKSPPAPNGPVRLVRSRVPNRSWCVLGREEAE